MSGSMFGKLLAASVAGVFACSTAQADIALSGPLPKGRWDTLLHLGANYKTDVISTNYGQGTDTDCLADFGGEKNQVPYPGLVYSGESVHSKSTSQEPANVLTWTPAYQEGGFWQPVLDRYISYWHIYLNVPGDQPRAVKFHLCQDDDVHIFDNGVEIVRSIGYCGTDTEKHSDTLSLAPGLHSITIKLFEGDGGDYMAIRMTDPDGNYFDDITYRLMPASLKVANPVTGCTDFTGSATVKVAEMFTDPLDDEYQLSLDPDPANLDDDSWKALATGKLPDATITLADLTEGATNTVYAFTRHLSGTPATNALSAAIVYTAAAPTVLTTSAAIPIDSINGTAVDPAVIDAGSRDAIGIFKRWVTPETITDAGTVTLHVMNNAGVEATATATVTVSAWLDASVAIDGNDVTGTGRPEFPWRTVTYALSRIPANGVVYVGPGVYTAGETFPLVPENASIIGDGDVVLDAENTADNIFVCSNGAFSVSNVDIRNSVRAAVSASGTAKLSFTDCAFTQSAENKGENYNGAFDLYSGADVTITRCSFTGIKRYAVIQDHSGSTFTAEDCLFQGNDLGHSTFNYQWQSASYLYIHGCQFLDNVTPQGAAHDAADSVVSYFDGCPYIEVDRCVVANNKTGNVIGFRNVKNYRISNCLIVGNETLEGVFEGYNSPVKVYNCTFIGNTGGYSCYNISTTIRDSIIMGDTKALSFNTPRGFPANPSGLTLVNTILQDANEGNGFNSAGSSVLRTDPILENVAVAWGNPAFDARPRPYSPAIDAADNATTVGDIDIGGNARIADNNEDGEATADIGCYESLFHAAVEPTFTVPVPGSLAGYRGIEYTIPVSIDPAVTDDVTASVTYGEGLTGDATISFAAGSPATLTFEIGSERVDFARITIEESGTDAGVLPAVLDVFLGDLVLTVDNRLRTFVRTGETFDLPVSLALDGAVAPGDIPLAIGDMAGDGSNSVSWQGDDVSRIPSGKHSSVGAVHVLAGAGLNAVVIGSGATFAETDDGSVTVEFVGYPGYVYVDPANGSDSNIGTLASPFQTIRAALAAVQDGDEVRLLPGDYTTATESFPINPGKVKVIGVGADGESAGDPATHVIDGGNASANIFAFEKIDGGVIRNVTASESTDAALFVDSSTVAVSNVVFTQTAANKGANGGILLNNNPTVTAEDCVFRGMTRRAAVMAGGKSMNNRHTFTASRCVFEDNDSEYATVAGEHNPSVIFYMYFTDCVFRDNAVTASNGQLSDAYRATVLFGRTSGRARFTRCQFLGGREGAVFGLNYFGGNNNNGDTEYTIDNCLFAGNYAPGGIFHGYNSFPVVRNCTFTGNTGGYNARAIQPTFQNCIVCGDGQVSFVPPDGAMEYKPITMQDTILWDTEEGEKFRVWNGTYTETNDLAHYATNLMRVDPKLRSALSYDAADIPDWQDADARLLSSSPAIDAGNNANAATPLDLFGSGRVKIGFSRNAEAIVDVGCFESDLVVSGTLLMLK